MKVQLMFCPWYQTMVVDLPITPEEGMHLELSDKDVDRYIALVKAADYPEEYGVKQAPNCIADDNDGYWMDLYVDTQIVEVNIVWDEESEAYLPQAVIDIVQDEDNDIEEDNTIEE